ncbi:grip [Metarhizium album ARSEF 1941]|uniref:Grip n=1 Tax=Metarhizium album (strain ARSEF 1941) TaxID=1081103 RepID=A0A0B2WKI1_METAS|nr:grip [Metarhizium album ARSEF 1941]KHN94438.1 grip [Metarhizium album ARSEF 1941]
MFQRIRGAIDRTIAEEQARQKSLESATPSRSGSTSSRRSDADPTGRRARAKKPSADITDSTVPNPDPAVFEAAFVIDDSDEPSRSGTPAPPLPPPPPEKDHVDGDGMHASKIGQADTSQTNGTNADQEHADGNAKEDGHAAAPTGLSPEIKQRLRKLEKLESTYPELLRSYRVAHKRATAIEPFEKALRENTPLTSINDPSSLVEYLNQLNLRGDMVMDELKKVSADKEELKKKHAETEERLKNTREELEACKSGISTKAAADPSERKPIEPPAGTSLDIAAEKAKSPVASVISMFSPKQKAQDTHQGKSETEDFFSYDEEIPQLQAEVASKAEEIEHLKRKVENLEKELSVAKESSTGLAESLEQTSRALSESRASYESQASLHTQLEERNAEIRTLTERLGATQSALKKLEDQADKDKKEHASTVRNVESCLAKSEKKAAELDAELIKAGNAKSISKKLIDDLNTQIKCLEQEKSQSLAKIESLTKKMDLPAATSQPAAAEATAAATPAAGVSKKKNNKKKKGKGGGGGGATAAVSLAEAEETKEAGDKADNAAPTSLKAEIAKLKVEVEERDEQIEKLSKKRKTEEDLREEIENLQENLVNIGQDHVEAKEKIKGLEKAKFQLEKCIAEHEAQVGSSQSNGTGHAKIQGDLDALRKEYDDLKNKSTALQSDLEAAQRLAQARFKELTALKEVLQKAQPELKSLRQESSELKTTKEELAAKVKELQAAEKREQDLKRDVSEAQQLATDGEKELRSLREKLKSEGSNKQRAEDGKRTAERDLRRAEADKIEVVAKTEKMERELQQARVELNTLRRRVKELEEQTHKLRREKAAAQEEAEFKSQQYSNAQGLLASMREQAAELSVQLKESKSQAESLEEELVEVQRLLQERTREGETMRRLLADVDERADTKIREMRGRMEAAIEERERMEDESSTLARRKTRESEELRNKIRELEREVKSLSNERDELEERQREWKRRRDELEAIESKASAETEEMRTTVSQLRSALDMSETQLRDGEKQRGDLRKMLDDSRVRYDKLAKDLKTAQSKLVVAGSSRSSMDSMRSSGNGNGDTAYLKTILLQFLEQKDGRLRAQLVPVLGKLLKFDRSDEQKWMNAVQHMEVNPPVTLKHSTASQQAPSMKSLTPALVVVAAAAAAAAVPLASGSAGVGSYACYSEPEYTPPCAPGQLCAQVAMPVEVCSWQCGAPPPYAWRERCRPCQADVCRAICTCEVFRPKSA